MEIIHPGDMEKRDLLPFPIVSSARAVDHHYYKEESEDARSPGLHVYDLLNGPGSKCSLFIQFTLLDVPPDSKKMAYARVRERMNLGHGVHESIYRIYKDAVNGYLKSDRPDIKLEDLRIEEEVHLPETGYAGGRGIVGTPDIVATFSGTCTDGVRRAWIAVVDVKSVENHRLERLRGKHGITAPAGYRRQLQMYMELKDALYGEVLWIPVGAERAQDSVKESTPVERDPSVLAKQKERVMLARDGIDLGNFQPSKGNHCKQCPWQTTCEKYGGDDGR